MNLYLFFLSKKIYQLSYIYVVFACLEIQFLKNKKQEALFEALQKLKEGQTVLSPQFLFPIQDGFYI